jgi:hypothetical protein
MTSARALIADRRNRSTFLGDRFLIRLRRLGHHSATQPPLFKLFRMRPSRREA